MKNFKDLSWEMNGIIYKFEENMGGPAARDLLLSLKDKTMTLKEWALLSPKSINSV